MLNCSPPSLQDTKDLVPSCLGGENHLRFVAAPHPFGTDRIELALPEGMTIAAMMAAARVEVPDHLAAHVFVDDWAIPRERWHVIRPRAGRLVTVTPARPGVFCPGRREVNARGRPGVSQRGDPGRRDGYAPVAAAEVVDDIGAGDGRQRQHALDDVLRSGDVGRQALPEAQQ